MAIDPSRGTPKDAATVSTLQSMTEESAKAAMRAPVEGAWLGARGSFIHNILDGLGAILSGTVQFAGEIFMAVVDGVVSLIKFTGQALESAWSWLTGGERLDVPANFMPLEESAYRVLEPVKSGVDEALETSRAAEAEMLLVSAQIDDLLPGIREDIAESQRLAGEAKVAFEAATQSNTITQRIVARAVASAASSSGMTIMMVGQANELLDEAELILAEVRAQNLVMQDHLDQAADSVVEARAYATTASSLVDDGRAILGSVSSTRDEVVAKHGEVLELHSGAIAANTSATQSALDATSALAESLVVQTDINTKHGEVLDRHGQAIRLVGSAAASAGQTAFFAMEATQALADTQQTHQDTLAVHGDMLLKHSDAVSKLGTAVDLQAEATRLQIILNRNILTALEVHENLMKWRDATRVRLGSTTALGGNPSAWSSMGDGRVLIRSADEQRRVEFTAPGSWAGRVVVFITWRTATITGDDYFTQHFYNVGPGARGTWFHRPRDLQFVSAVTVFVEPWWGMTNREFVFQVGGPSGDTFVKTDAYEAPLRMVTWMKNNVTGSNAPKFTFPVTANYPVSGQDADMAVTHYDTGQTIPAGSMLFPRGEIIPPDPTPVFPPVVKFTEVA